MNHRSRGADDNDDFTVLLRLIDLRMQAFKEAQTRLSHAARKNEIGATISTITIIVLGAVVAIRGSVEQLMNKAQADISMQMIPEITFTIIGLMISITAGINSAFKFSENAKGLRVLSQRAASSVMIFMSRVDKPDSDDKVLETIIDEQNIQLDSLYSDALKFNVDLSLNSSVDFSELQAFRRYQAQ